MKKLFAMLVAICLIAALLPTTVFAEANPARFVFANEEKVSDLEVEINEGDMPVYLKTVGKKVTAANASESDYNIKVTYEVGKNPTIYLKSAEIETYGDANEDYAITIGSPVVGDECNDVSVDVVIERNSTFTHTKTYCSSHFNSYITGALTFIKEKGTLALGYATSPSEPVISAVGDIVIKATVTMQCGLSATDRTYGIRSSKGSIILDGGSLTITTNTDTNLDEKPVSRKLIYTETEGENIIIQNGAKLKVNLRNSAKVFSTLGSVIIRDSVVDIKATAELGTIFGDEAPVVEGYAEGYTALGDDAAYDPAKFDSYKTFYIEPKVAETEPSTEATTPSTEATKPSTEATTPSTEATKPSTEATTPSTEATKPSTEATTPSAEATAPGDKDAQSKPINTNTVILIVALIVIVVSWVAAAVIILKKKAEDAEEKEESQGTTEE